MNPKVNAALPPALPLWKRCLRAVPALIVLILLTLLFTRLAGVHVLEPAIMDAEMRLLGTRGS